MKYRVDSCFKTFFSLLLIGAVTTLLLNSCDLNGLLKQGSTKKTAILYGVTIYDNRTGAGNYPNLSWPVNDINSMQSLLNSQGWDVIVRTEDTGLIATKTQLAADIQTIQTSLEAGQRVLFYYSGHGIDDDGSLVLFGGVTNDPGGPNFDGVDITQCVTPAELASMFQPIVDAKGNLVVVLDSCFSGQYVATGPYTTNLPADYNTDLFTADSPGRHPAFTQSITDYFNNAYQTGAEDSPNLWVLSAAGIESSYDDNSEEHGAFTAAFLHGMDITNNRFNADYNADGFVTLSELNRYTTEWLTVNWNNLNPSDQNGVDARFLPHLSGNPLDILLFKK